MVDLSNYSSIESAEATTRKKNCFQITQPDSRTYKVGFFFFFFFFFFFVGEGVCADVI